MFGEDTLAFTKEINIRSQNRISLPPETYVESKDKITLYEKDKHLMLCNYKDISNHLKSLKRLSDNAFKKGDLKLKAIYDYEIKLISISIFKTNEVDDKHRISLSDDIINRFNYSDSIYISGILNTAIIFKDLDDKYNFEKELKLK